MLPVLPHDKAMHCLYGVVLFAATNAALGPLMGLAGAVVVGGLKECLDWLDNRKQIAAGLPPKHGVEFMDFVATGAGGLLGFVCGLEKIA